MNTEAVERSLIWADEAVLQMIRIWVGEKIQQQLDICSKRPIYEKMGKQWLHPFIFSSKKVKDSNSLPVGKRNTSKLFCSVTGLAQS